MRPDLAVVNASEVATMSACRNGEVVQEESLGLIHDGAILVEGGKIAWTGTMKQYKALSIGKPLKTVEASGCLVTPGFVDPHSHIIFGGSREDEFDRKLRGESYTGILASGGGILRTIRATRAATDKELLESAKSRLVQLMMNGVTTLEVKTGYGQDILNEERTLSVAKRLAIEYPVEIIPTFLGLHAIPPEFSSAAEYTNYVIRDVLPYIAKSQYRPLFSDCFCETGVFDSRLCEAYLRASASLGFRTKVHADEFSQSGGAELAAQSGSISADHLENSTEHGLEMMAKGGVVAVLLPGTALYSGIRPADASLIQHLGCTIALGTDLSPNSWIESPQIVMTLACTMMRISPAQALAAFTFGSALAVGRSDIGRLVPGTAADFVIHRVPNYRFLSYRLGGNYVVSVFKRGAEVPVRYGGHKAQAT